MSFLSRVKPTNLLGRKLSNRYLSRDAFTSRRHQGRSRVGRLGTAFKGRRSLFEIKYSVMRVFIFIILLCVLIYSIPTFRYGIHRLLTKQFVLTNEQVEASDELLSGEFYVAPKYLTTDTFITNSETSSRMLPGAIVIDALTEAPLGVIDATSSPVVIQLFSSPGYKHSFLLEDVNVEAVEIVELSSSSTSTPATTTTQSSRKKMSAVLFEGAGYGEIIAKLPPQNRDIQVGTKIYIRTVEGLKAVAVINRVSTDTSTGSTFTVVYGQLLVSPQSIFKMKILEE